MEMKKWIDDLLYELNAYASDYDRYMGLPTYDEGTMSAMREIVMKHLPDGQGEVKP